MTDFVNPASIEGDLTSHLIALTGGGADYTFECIGKYRCNARGIGIST